MSGLYNETHHPFLLNPSYKEHEKITVNVKNHIDSVSLHFQISEVSFNPQCLQHPLCQVCATFILEEKDRGGDEIPRPQDNEEFEFHFKA